MRQFFKFLFASAIGSLLAFFLVFLFMVAFFSAMVASIPGYGDESASISQNSIYAPSLSTPIVERAVENPFSAFGDDFPGFQTQMALPTLLKTIRHAKDNPKINALFLDLSVVMAGRAQMQEIRDELEDFKSSGKPIYAYGDFYTGSSYWLASVADSVFLQPTGMLEFTGMVREMVFVKRMMEKLDIDPIVLKQGRFKSAGEMFSEEEMTPANRQQNRELMASMYQHFLHQIADSRSIDTATLRQYADSFMIRDAKDAVKLGLVDRLIHKDEVLQLLAKTSSKASIDDLKLVSFNDYHKATKKLQIADDKVAIVYANGSIVMGNGQVDQIGSNTLSEAIRKARLDDDVKAVVLRVNSPGGSALASDVILREMALTKKVKPVVVSMGDVAASGGYYISCKADKIIAQPNTITGSIGVIGILFNTQQLFNERLGIDFDRVKTGPYADLGNPNRPMTEQEKRVIEQSLEDIYDDFISHVAEGRSMDKSRVDALGGGRIWTGSQAMANGLVDTLGGLDLAVAEAAKAAGIGEYQIKEYPKAPSPFDFMKNDLGLQLQEAFLQKTLGQQYKSFKKIQELQELNGILMWMPFVEL